MPPSQKPKIRSPSNLRVSLGTSTYINTRSVIIDDKPAFLIFFERSNGRGTWLNGERFSLVVSDTGVLKNLTRMNIGMNANAFISPERACRATLRFLQKEAPDLLQRMKINWIKPRNEMIQMTQQGQRITITLTDTDTDTTNTGNS